MAGWGMKYIVMFLVIDAIIFSYGIAGTTPIMLTNYAIIGPDSFNNTPVSGNAWYGSVNINATSINDLGLNASLNGTASGQPPGFSLWNTLTLAWRGLSSVAQFVFAPVTFLSATGAPMPIILILGVVPSVGFIVAILSFVRGKDF